jgi:hypothetical protein
MVLGVGLLSTTVFADSLADWAASYSKPETQQKILNRIFPDQVGTVSDAIQDKTEGTYLFPKGTSWVQLGKNTVPGASYFIVTCMLYHRPVESPISAVSYVFRGTDQRPVAISAGYASRERVYQVTLPKLGKTFLLMMDSLGFDSSRRWSASLLEVGERGPDNNPPLAWTSDSSYNDFQVGFSVLNGNAEELVLRTVTASASSKCSEDSMNACESDYGAGGFGESNYAAYAWDGERFRTDGFAPSDRLKALPESVWQYGTGR